MPTLFGRRCGDMRSPSLILCFLAAGTIALGLLTGCASAAGTGQEEPAPSSTSALTSPSPTGSFDSMDYQPDAAWECGYVSALETAALHAQGLLSRGSIDQAAFEQRQLALQQAWSVAPQGRSDVTPLIRVADTLATSGQSIDSDAFRQAVGAIGAACETAHAPIVLGTLGSLGG